MFVLFGKSRIFKAVHAGDVEKVKSLLRWAPRLANARNKQGRTPLHVAAPRGHRAIAKLLIENGADVDAVDPGGRSPMTPLEYMCRWKLGHGPQIEAMTKLLLAKGASINGSPHSEGTPLHIAVAWKRESIVAVLLSHGADPNAKNKNQRTPLHEAARSTAAIAVLLLQNGAEVDAKDVGDETPLHSAVMYRNCDVARVLMANGADPRAKRNWTPGRTPVELARQDREILEILGQTVPKQAFDEGKVNGVSSVATLVDMLLQIGNMQKGAYLGLERRSARLIGERLEQLGGKQAMLRAHAAVRGAFGKVAGRELEVAWDGIGTWAG